MMKKIGTRAFVIIVAALICMATVSYAVFAFPAIQKTEDRLDAEIKLYEEQITAIMDLSGKENEIEALLLSMQERIDQRETSLGTEPDMLEVKIKEILESLNITGNVVLGEARTLLPAGKYRPAVSAKQIGILFNCDLAGGETAMQLMEDMPSAHIVITDFIFEKGVENNLGKWVVNAELYYFDSESEIDSVTEPGN